MPTNTGLSLFAWRPEASRAKGIQLVEVWHEVTQDMVEVSYSELLLLGGPGRRVTDAREFDVFTYRGQGQ